MWTCDLRTGASIGAELATINSAAENELARQACGYTSCWIGLEEVGGDASTPRESQTWRWRGGPKLNATYTNWGIYELGNEAHQPNNLGGLYDERFVAALELHF